MADMEASKAVSETSKAELASVLGYGSAERTRLAAGRLSHGAYRSPGACPRRPDHVGDTRSPLKISRMLS